MRLGHIGDGIPTEWSKPFLTDLVNPKQWKTISTKELLAEGYAVYGANGKIGFYNKFTHEQPTLMVTCRGATCGNIHISEPYSYINGNAMALGEQPTELLGINFLRHAIEARGLEDTISGSAQPQITRQGLSEVRIPLPPLAEQKAIADKLDTLLAHVETTKARLALTPDILKLFRQSVLAAAVSGKLTEEWRESNDLTCFTFDALKAAKKKLIESKIIKKDLEAEQAEPAFEIPSSWLYVKLQSVASKITDGEHKTPKRENSGQYLLSARNIQDGYISVENVDYVGDEEFNKLRKRCDPNKGDILISCSGSVGRVCLVDQNEKYVMVRSAALVRILDEFIKSKFLMYFLQSPPSQKNIKESSKSTAQSNLFLGPIKELGLALPSLEEQTEIVRRVEELFAFADRIEQKANAALERVNNLTQSILAKAFRGELTADWRAANPDLISGENSSEALLEKIKAEREAMKPVKKTRPRKKA